MRSCLSTVCYAMLASLVTYGPNMGIQAVRVSLRSQQSLKNEDICDQIENSWWPLRLQMNSLSTFTASSDVCAAFDGNEEACNDKSSTARADIVAENSMTSQEAQTSCIMAGAGSKTCLSNPCENLNNGNCTLQNSGGNW